MSKVSPATVLEYTAPTPDFLCPLSANTFGVDFLAFKIRDIDSKSTVFEVSKDANAPPPEYPANFDYDRLRRIEYKFPAAFLSYKTVGTKLTFTVGNQPLKNFRMIERHYYAGKLVKSYDFNFAFCIPNSTNEWEAIYDMPEFPQATIDEMISNPAGTDSDSFYFVDGTLMMHNKAKYHYVKG